MSREELYGRIPEIWRRLDTEGVLDRFFGVMDWEFDRIHDLIEALLDLQNVNAIPDQFLPLLAAKVGHIWRNEKDRAWNRRGIEHAIERHSYKGTITRLGDVIADGGGVVWALTDQASKLCIPGMQGQLGLDDCALVSADYWHDGAFVLDVDDAVDLDELAKALIETCPGGERWYVRALDELGLLRGGWFMMDNEEITMDREDLTMGLERILPH